MGRMKRYWIALMALALAAPLGGETVLTGYYKHFFTAFRPAPYQWSEEIFRDPVEGISQARLRLNLKTGLSENLRLEAAWDLSPVLTGGDFAAAFGGELQLSEYRAADFDRRLYPGPDGDVGSFTLTHNLDRLFFSLRLDFADIYIGRQAISWGSAHFINPTDIISPFTFNELDVEDRRGVDALRVRIPVGALDELDFGYVAGKDFRGENSTWFARGKFYLLNTDASLLVMNFRQNLLLGLDLTRAVGGAGVWLEGAHVVPGFFAQGAVDTDPYTRVSAGVDYNFPGGWYAFLEYHYSSAGVSDPERYLEIFQRPAVTEGAVYLMGRHYLNAAVVHQIHPLVPVTALVIWNPGDGSLVFAPSAEYNLRENVYLALGAYLGFGEKAQRISDPLSGETLPVLRSEFGLYPDLVYTSFRIYF